MFHLHIALVKWLPFINFTSWKDDAEVKKYEKNIVPYKGHQLYEFNECRVCQQRSRKIDWLVKSSSEEEKEQHTEAEPTEAEPTEAKQG